MTSFKQMATKKIKKTSSMSEDSNKSLGSLSTEILLVVFSNLSIPDLINLKKTCSRFYEIIHYYWDIIIFNRREQFLVTNQCNESIQKRSRKLLALSEKHRISNNWQVGRYSDNYKFLSRNSIPYFHLERNSIWFGSKSLIICCQRNGHKIIMHRTKYKLHSFDFSDICKFVVKNNYVSVVNGHSLRVYSLRNGQYTCSNSPISMYGTSIDMESDLIAIGSKEGHLELFPVSVESGPVTRMKFKDRVWSLCFNRDKLAVGTAANNYKTSIVLVDTERGLVLQELPAGKQGGGVLHMRWENPTMMWSGGYDTYLRRWDLRVGECVQTFLDPWGSKVNCFDIDFVNTVMTGCDASRATLWDVRKDRYVQIYHVKSEKISPIYCLSFDAEYLFAATDSYLNMLDFSVMKGCVRDYSRVFSKQFVI